MHFHHVCRTHVRTGNVQICETVVFFENAWIIFYMTVVRHSRGITSRILTVSWMVGIDEDLRVRNVGSNACCN